MVDMGFKDDVEKIIHFVKEQTKKVQIILFSATMPIWALRIVENHMKYDRIHINLIESS